MNTPQYEIAVTASVELITPEMASAWLGNNGRNRSISQAVVNRYARDMLSGNWEINGETIVFYEDGTLKDGQHRLEAIVKAGVPQWMIVVRGVENDIAIHDRGRVRSVANVMEIAGYEANLKSTASIGAINIMSCYYLGKNFRPTDAEITSFADKYGDYLSASITAARALADKQSIARKSPVIAAMFCALYSGVPYDHIEEFAKIVNTGFYTDEGKSSAIVLRNYILSINKRSDIERMALFGYTLMAIADFENGVPRKKAYTVIKPTDYEKKVAKEIFGKSGAKDAAA